MTALAECLLLDGSDVQFRKLAPIVCGAVWRFPVVEVYSHTCCHHSRQALLTAEGLCALSAKYMMHFVSQFHASANGLQQFELGDYLYQGTDHVDLFGQQQRRLLQHEPDNLPISLSIALRSLLYLGNLL